MSSYQHEVKSRNGVEDLRKSVVLINLVERKMGDHRMAKPSQVSTKFEDHKYMVVPMGTL